MLSLCGCSSRRRGNSSTKISDENAAPRVKLSLEPSETVARSTAFLPGEGRLSLDDFGVQTLDLPKRKGSNALETVKSKLIRHLSYDKNSSPKPQASADHDKEEIARRAELRRFRARRIQEELNQDYTKSLSTHASIRSTKYLSPLIDIGRPGRGPRDAIEFSIDSSGHMPAPFPSPMPSPTSFQSKSSTTLMKRWSSCPAAIGELSGHVATPTYIESNTSSLWKRYTAPGQISESRSLPNLLQPRMRAPQLARTKPTTFDSEITDTLDSWLILQKSRPRRSATSSAANHTLPSLEPRWCHNPSSGKRLTDFSQDTVKKPFPSRQSVASQRLPSVSRPAIEHRGSRATISLRTDSANGPRQPSLVATVDGKRNISSTSSQGRIDLSETPRGLSSSYYPSVMPSIQPSPSRSDSPVNILSMRDLQSLELSPFEWHDNNSILRSFGTSADDQSSYATAENGENDSQDSPRIHDNSNKRSHDGHVDEKLPPSRRFADTLSLRKRGESNRLGITANNSRYSNPNLNIRTRTERTGLPTTWRSGSGSWDIQSSLPKRISSKLWYQSRTVSATIPETETPMTVFNMEIIANEPLNSTDATLGARKTQEGVRTTLRKSKVNTSADSRTSRTQNTRMPGNPDRSLQPHVLSRNSVAYNALQKVSQRNSSAPPVSWKIYQPRKQNQNPANLLDRRSQNVLASHGQEPRRLSHHDCAENRDRRSISFPAKIGDLVETVITRLISSRKSSESLKIAGPEPAPSKVLPLEPLKIDEVQTSPVLGEIEIIRSAR